MLTPSQLERRKNRTIEAYGRREVTENDLLYCLDSRFEREAMDSIIHDAGWHPMTLYMRGFKLNPSKFIVGDSIKENVVRQVERWAANMKLKRYDIEESIDEKQMTLI